jgi:hypothetical protein
MAYEARGQLLDSIDRRAFAPILLDSLHADAERGRDEFLNLPSTAPRRPSPGPAWSPR